MKRRIIGFHQDGAVNAASDWVADLECGHSQHLRHQPPWTLRPWVLTEEGRRAFLGHELVCLKCTAPQ